ncbi:unnamed protein product [Cuscuta epithymum]|uniref:Uncharacterized protein n=1 Tax=Cuscuta epithymum TaxID=186058 RepID=A0AAV0CYZ6_9ASTE|nr:unnamed protein product [Cuscuta epithymum]
MDSLCKSARDSYSPFDALLFDMDDTLYSSKVGIGQALKNNIDDFLVEKIGFARSEASALRIELFKKYGSSLAGLRALGYDIDADEYHSFVHGRLPYNLIKPDSELKNLLCSINQRKIIFTNSDRVHALKVLDRLGIKDCFEQIICFETMNPNLSLSSRPDEIPVVLKPAREAMRIALDSAHVDPKRTLFLDDNVQNIAAGNVVGLRTALVGTTSKSKECDYALENIHDLIRVIPEIWFEKENDDQKVCCTRSQMGSFLAPTTVGA